ncbi:MAG TPA: hypothetical protein DCF49_00210 [Lachnospiraceae bacterium]|jgi:hypothetical protein|nr:hypothetical protein [Lachnospiraceae bacterium]
MRYSEVYDALKETGLPVTYEFWENGDIPPLPYIVFTYPDNDDFIADNTNYSEIVTLQVGLYTKRRSVAVERGVENVLKQYFTPYRKTSDYVSADSLQETLYTLEVAING